MTRWVDITRRHLVDTGMAMCLIALLLNIFLPAVPYTRWILLVVLLISMTAPHFLKPVALLWFNLSEILGGIMSKLLLSIIFFAVVTPIGAIYRRFRANPLQLKNHMQSVDSHYVRRNHTYVADDIKHPY